jgi:membrane-associated PAP2 superfamily phosphatase
MLQKLALKTPWAWLCLALFALLAWDYSALDSHVSALFAGPQGFAWRTHWLTSGLLHHGTRNACIAVFLLWCVNVVKPLHPSLHFPRKTQLYWLFTALLMACVIALIKYNSPTSCAWDLAQFGGPAVLQSHWLWLSDGGAGRCFPSAHLANAGVPWAAYCLLRRRRQHLAAKTLPGLVAFTLLMAATQVVRGAHLLSHTLYSMWIISVTCVCAYTLETKLWRSPIHSEAPDAIPPTAC